MNWLKDLHKLSAEEELELKRYVNNRLRTVGQKQKRQLEYERKQDAKCRRSQKQ